ncbi:MULTISPECIES: nucleotide sugar dehydrogenase [Streptomyces]|uniref:nucleotide sugar dehydrogenase n=1 Tax=Streptomyces TaxID=1883 RepID=UPI00163C94B3|nr:MULTISPECIES: nucleotide sugar dehydrogenase [Streptomyces]MBC2873787.1 nucleotide sugar dehydrogenase [Streptomyces sp. TYQ1024]UBI37790.1 nucleotide sugar dehydrogenase [Streptomyces mobaraensis]UKW30378.1 nucleotide sugar dehydrogenase [Streptomyces sp. TYQ1024]
MRIVVAGQGYVGLPLAARAAEVGHQVVGYEIDRDRLAHLVGGTSYVEDIPDERLRPLLATGSYRPSADPATLTGFDLAVITVPTPLRYGVPDLTHIKAAGETLAGHLRPGATVVLESTTYPGTTEELLGPVLEKGSGLIAGPDFHLGYSPERIDPGNRTWRLETTPKIVAGIDEASLRAVESFYQELVEHTVPVSSCKVAELTKLLENTFRHVNIALINETAILARDLGVDIWEAIRAGSTKPFGFMPFTPGPGVGGHCLPIDPHFLSWRVERALARTFRFVELATDINGHMPDYVVRRLGEALNDRQRSVKGSRILLMGLAYKKNTGDARESPSSRVADLLLALGAEVRGADPHVVEDSPTGAHLIRVDATAQEIAASDAVVLLTDHDAFDYKALLEHAPYILDCRNRLSGTGTHVEAL